jgi:hypothetical protein
VTMKPYSAFSVALLPPRPSLSAAAKVLRCLQIRFWLQLQSLCSGLGAGGPEMQGIAFKYS